MLVKRHEVPHDAVVELEGALVLGEHVRIDGKPRDGVVAVLAEADAVGELAPPPVIDLDLLAVQAKQAVEAVELLIDGGIIEGGVEDVDRLVFARHGRAILPVVVAPPADCGRRDM